MYSIYKHALRVNTFGTKLTGLNETRIIDSHTDNRSLLSQLAKNRHPRQVYSKQQVYFFDEGNACTTAHVVWTRYAQFLLVNLTCSCAGPCKRFCSRLRAWSWSLRRCPLTAPLQFFLKCLCRLLGDIVVMQSVYTCEGIIYVYIYIYIL